jgi:alkanesulfonate monooxygenase SsuD/methylene tetrahydromethanopterin reductase-like flavin-dependent oxidoreductase (luciferase family)
MKISITISALALNWQWWKQLAQELEPMGFASLFRGDHFPVGAPPLADALELISSLTYLADHTHRMDIGSLVAPLSFHDPVMLARQAMCIDDLSGGRMILGVGAGWAEQEHLAFGYTLGTPKTRLDRLEEGLEIIHRLMRHEEPVSFQGRLFRLQEARLLPRPKRPTRILLGGKGPQRTLPLVARYADLWNCETGTPQEFEQLSARLDDLLIARGRAPGDVRRTILIPVLCYHTSQELHQAFDHARAIPVLSGASDIDLQNMLASMNGIVGRPDEVIEKIQAYARAGVEELVIWWSWVGYLDGLQAIAREILPSFSAERKEPERGTDD